MIVHSDAAVLPDSEVMALAGVQLKGQDWRGRERMVDRAPSDDPASSRLHRIGCGSRLTVMTGTSNSSVSMNATRPSGPKASGISSCRAGKVPT